MQWQKSDIKPLCTDKYLLTNSEICYEHANTACCEARCSSVPCWSTQYRLNHLEQENATLCMELREINVGRDAQRDKNVDLMGNKLRRHES